MIYMLSPSSTAALLEVLYVDANGEPRRHSAIFMSEKTGVRVGIQGQTMESLGWPPTLQVAVEQHFKTLFGLEHEAWKGEGPSPRAQHLNRLQSWCVEA